MKRLVACQSIAVLLLSVLTDCNQQQSPEELKEKTAQATANARRNAQAVAEGIREGWSRSKPLDLNSASRDDLMSLPGINAADADKVIAARPYDKPDDLLTRHIVSKAEYDRISDRITARK